MIPTNNPEVDYRALVRRSYDVCAEAYGASRRGEPGIEIRGLLGRLENGSAVLDIGCSTGLPIARYLADRCSVTGVDVSREMVRRAQENVPRGEFLCDDVMSVEFESARFDAVVAFYSIFHIPRDKHQSLFSRVREWLKPGVYLLCTLSHAGEAGYTEDDFFGVTMYWSNYGLSEYLVMLADAGFCVVDVASTSSGYEDSFERVIEDHPLALAQKR